MTSLDDAAGPGATARPAERTCPAWRVRLPALARGPASRQALLLAACLAAGIAETWPRVTYLAGRLPATRDAGGYVWDLWWVAHQVIRLRDPWFTRHLAAPVGAQLGYHTLMPLPGVLLLPVTLTLGPSFSYNLLSVACPGLLTYAMYRAARLWLPDRTGAVAAGVFFGLSPILAWRAWYEVNLAAGALFLPLALEAAIRLRRRPCPRRALVLGAVLGAAVLTDQESAVMAAMLTVAVLAPWLARRPSRAKTLGTALALAVMGVVASPQLAAMAEQTAAGAAQVPVNVLAGDFNRSGAGLTQMFAPSPRLASFGLPGLSLPYYRGGPPSMVVAGYGVTLSLLALAGVAVAWRRRGSRALALGWLVSSALALGSTLWIGTHTYRPLPQRWHNVQVSLLLPFTWFARLPGMANFREADRFTELGLLAAAMLAGACVGWLRHRSLPLLGLVAVLALLETGWSGNPPVSGSVIGVMPATMTALDAPIAASHTESIVVDVPFGIRGGLPVSGEPFPPQSMVLAAADAHPLADAFISRNPPATIIRIRHHPFYAGLMRAQRGDPPHAPGRLRAAESDARRMDVGWVLVWVKDREVTRYLQRTGFRFAYRADGASVYRPAGRSTPCAGAVPRAGRSAATRAAQPMCG